MFKKTILICNLDKVLHDGHHPFFDTNIYHVIKVKFKFLSIIFISELLVLLNLFQLKYFDESLFLMFLGINFK